MNNGHASVADDIVVARADVLQDEVLDFLWKTPSLDVRQDGVRGLSRRHGAPQAKRFFGDYLIRTYLPFVQ